MLPKSNRIWQILLAYAAPYVCTNLLCPTRAPNLFYGKKIGEKNRLGAGAPKDPKSRGLASESLPAYPAVDTAAAIGTQTAGIRTPLSDGIVLTIGFGGRRRPDVVLMVGHPGVVWFSGDLRERFAKGKGKHFCGVMVREAVAWRCCGGGGFGMRANIVGKRRSGCGSEYCGGGGWGMGRYCGRGLHKWYCGGMRWRQGG